MGSKSKQNMLQSSRGSSEASSGPIAPLTQSIPWDAGSSAGHRKTLYRGWWVAFLMQAAWLTRTFPRQRLASWDLWQEQSKEAFLFPTLLAASCLSQVDPDPTSRFARQQNVVGLGRKRDRAVGLALGPSWVTGTQPPFLPLGGTVLLYRKKWPPSPGSLH